MARDVVSTAEDAVGASCHPAWQDWNADRQSGAVSRDAGVDQGSNDLTGGSIPSVLCGAQHATMTRRRAFVSSYTPSRALAATIVELTREVMDHNADAEITLRLIEALAEGDE